VNEYNLGPIFNIRKSIMIYDELKIKMLNDKEITGYLMGKKLFSRKLIMIMVF
jgi:hypothetical protein